ncbi:hypothetical protein HALLA_04760 [Halostagnicola larsenii XH-48]|uniref:Uncharacterized protein n=1 Tax=Halostagnicola larsenii XH-48 TaxID=797299 RepID=W0JPP8_9EURY|nr:hypothetical protein HALLA_04760 [Halostagnicola larsenii XH-48]
MQETTGQQMYDSGSAAGGFRDEGPNRGFLRADVVAVELPGFRPNSRF